MELKTLFLSLQRTLNTDRSLRYRYKSRSRLQKENKLTLQSQRGENEIGACEEKFLFYGDIFQLIFT